MYLACYALWVGFVLVGAWLILQGRAAMFDLAVWLRWNPWAVDAVAQFAVVTLGLIWLVAILGTEYYLRQGVVKERLWRRAFRLFVIEAVLAGIFVGMQLLLV